MDNGIYTGIYKGKEMLGFKKDHVYVFDLKFKDTTYLLHAFSELIDKDNIEEVDLYMPYSSEISINRNWDIKINENTKDKD